MNEKRVVKHYPQVENAFERLKEMCYKPLFEKYGTQDRLARFMMGTELEALRATGMCSYMLQVSELLQRSGLRACDISLRGPAGASMVAYLLGISSIDPLAYGLEPEFVFGNRRLKEIDIDINVSPNCHDRVIQNAGHLEGVGHTIRVGGHPGAILLLPEGFDYTEYIPVSMDADGHEVTCGDYRDLDSAFLKLDILEQDSLGMLERLAELTGVDIESIPLDSQEVLDLFKPNADGAVTGCMDLPDFKSYRTREIIKTLEPRSFDDLVKILGIAHGTGTYEENAKILVEEQGLTLKDLIASRDDLLNMHWSLGFETGKAFDMAVPIWKGRARQNTEWEWEIWKQLLLDAGAPAWYVWSCEQIGYLFPRAQSISYLMVNLRLGWFKVNYPKEFEQVISNDC